MKAHGTLIPTRFMCSISYLVAAIMVFSTMTENVLASLPKTYATTQFDANSTSLLVALIITCGCIGVNLLGFMSGFSMFIPAVNVIVIISHTLGCIYTCIFIMEGWHYLTAWYMLVFFAGPVALLEVCIIMASFCLGGLNRV
mmetsp:Transcript_29703/g.70702  ORF Transcript_29703/g.70702 Transcript_29703/m.70702 type:complete len:142 (-) Transcript_29703:90-515(-)